MTDCLLVAGDSEGVLQEQVLARLGTDADLRVVNEREPNKYAEVTIALGPPAAIAPLLRDLLHLKWVQSSFAGVDVLLKPELRHDYVLSKPPDVFGPSMAEYVMGYLLSLERNHREHATRQGQGAWHPLPYRSLVGRTIGICGLGSVGLGIAKVARAFGLRVVGYRRREAPAPEVDTLFTGNDFHALLRISDFVVNALPRTPATRHMFDATAFSTMRPGTVFFNVGRGGTVDTQALLQALGGPRLRAAVLDVFEEEPLPTDHPLWRHVKVIATPHIAAESFPEDIARAFIDNLTRYRAGEPLHGLVDWALGY